MFKKITAAAIAAICLGAVSSNTLADDDDDDSYGCTIQMTAAAGGSATVTLKGNKIRAKVKNALPDTLYTIWVTFSGSPDRPAGSAGSAPAFAVTAPVYGGMRTDPNGFFTDDEGDGGLNNNLGYNLLDTGAAPVTTGHNMQGLNRVGRDWMRVYGVDKNVAASVQLVDANGTPLVERATATGIAMVSHPDTTTHGGSPGVGGVDQNGAFKGALADCN